MKPGIFYSTWRYFLMLVFGLVVMGLVLAMYVLAAGFVRMLR
jgi:hypothetical protein